MTLCYSSDSFFFLLLCFHSTMCNCYISLHVLVLMFNYSPCYLVIIYNSHWCTMSVSFVFYVVLSVMLTKFVLTGQCGQYMSRLNRLPV